jgi:hypothetical protein
MALEARAIEVGDLQGEGFLEPQSSAGDSGAVDLVVQGGSGREEPPALLNTEDGGEMMCGVRTHEREGMPIALEDVLREETDATRAEAHGRWRETSNALPVQPVVLQLLFRDDGGGCVRERREKMHGTDIGLLGPLCLATQVKRSQHVLTQWGHELSPFLS